MYNRLLSMSAVYQLNLAVAGLIAATSVGVAGSAALFESLATEAAVTNVMSYVETGKTFRLGAKDTMILSYFGTCVRETITGGTVTIGIDHSNVQGGIITRTKLDCSPNFVLSGNSGLAAGRVFRGGPQTEPSSDAILLDSKEGL